MNKNKETIQIIIKAYFKYLIEFGFDDSEITLDYNVLNDVVNRYLLDVERLHQFHDIQYIDCHKIAGYLTYWICKLRPVVVSKPDIVYDSERYKKAELANEIVSLILSIARIDEDKQQGVNRTRVSLKKEFVNAFLYTLHYRPINADNLALIYYFIDECANSSILHSSK